LALGGIALQQRADLLEIDLESDSLIGLPSERIMDALIFSTPSNNIKSIFVAGNKIERKSGQWRTNFVKTMAEL